ncbi:MAG: helix-turn-helix domain-containing protein [Steroidobacteraceae bacterium]
MPWQECSKVEERLRFVARLLDGEKMAVLCREFDISRKTGYKLFSRFKDCGLQGQPQALLASQSAAVSGREADSAAQAGAPQLGCSEDPGAGAQ